LRWCLKDERERLLIGTVVQLRPKRATESALACSSFWWLARWVWPITFARCYHFVESFCQLICWKKLLL